MRWLAALGRPEEPSPPQEFLRFLWEARAARRPDDSPSEGGLLDLWEPHELLAYARSTIPQDVAGFGVTWRRPASGIAAPEAPVTHDVPLACHDEFTPSACLLEVLQQRRSSRIFSILPIPLALLSEFLSRTFQRQTEGLPYPSAGGLYEVSLCLAIAGSEQIPEGFYRYDSAGHGLVRLATTVNVQHVLSGIRQGLQSDSSPALAIFLLDDFNRLFGKYQGFGLSLAYLNSGVLLQTLHLVATDLGLASCILGWTYPLPLQRATGRHLFDEGPVGALALGLPAGASSS